MRSKFKGLAAACLCLLLSVSLLAQEAAKTPAVKINLLVLDDSKHAVNDVTQEELHVFEDEVEQKITLFSKDEAPLSYGLAIDNSGSLRSQIEDVIEAAREVVNANKAEDETFVLRFVDRENINILQDFTSNKAALNRALDSLYPEGGQTALIDAVYTAAKHVAERKQSANGQNRRSALILISDGENRDSLNKTETLFNFLRENDVQIFVIGLVELLGTEAGGFNKKPKPRDSIELLERLAKETGGRAFYPKSAKQLTETVNDIMRDLRTQYVIGYTPASNPKSKPYRKLKVTVTGAKGREKRSAIIRAGYTAKQ
ncbi:MAG: VWA domain-containing protein [Acidobacteria bacterium]|nr:VWA domain-containing protein [Acidobacteriota bacterium]